jgi:ferredoxin-NADP reductase
VRELVLAPLARPLSFKPGQWVSLKLPVGDQPPLNRAYTLAEPASNSGQLTLVFDRVPGGLGSGYLYSLREGSEVALSGPYGNFTLPDPPDKELVLIARYSGLVPFHCMVRQLFLSRATGRPVLLVASAPQEEELLYHTELLSLACRFSEFRYLPLVFSPTTPPEAEVAAIGKALRTILGQRRDFIPMICGIKAFVRPMRAFFTDLGLDRRDVRVETYD